MSDQAPTMTKRRVFFYVDGFNLYHRFLEKNPSYKWLCLRKLSQEFLFPTDEVRKIKFFTAKVDPNSTTSPRQLRQTSYWKALESTGVEVIEGLMEKRDRECKADHICDKKGIYQQYTEKMSDVNLALHIYRDFIQEKPDVICVLSADLDVLPALKMIRETRQKVMIKILLPSQDDGLMFSRAPQFTGIGILKQLSETFVKKSRMAECMTYSDGTAIPCPDTWR